MKLVAPSSSERLCSRIVSLVLYPIVSLQGGKAPGHKADGRNQSYAVLARLRRVFVRLGRCKVFRFLEIESTFLWFLNV
jgi:hypothetical protein